MSYRQRVAILIGMFVVVIAGVFLFVDPVSQNPAYYQFADQRSWLGIANFGDVMSNAAFLIAGVLGLWFVLRPEGRTLFDHPSDAWPYIVFFFGLVLICFGSAYFHLEPNTEGLVWDRLAMTVSFTALFSAFVADRVHRRFGIYWLLPILAVVGLLTVVYWGWTESQGRGDLRPYGLVQFYLTVALVIVYYLFQDTSRYTDGRHLIGLLAAYGAAKAFEHYDKQVFDFLAGAISGHTLKHVAAAAGGLVVIRMLAEAQKSRNGSG